MKMINLEKRHKIKKLLVIFLKIVIISQLSKEKLEQCKSIFNSNDINNKGSIPSKKLNFVLRSLGAYVPPDDLEEFIGNKKEIKFDKFISFFAEYYTKKIDKGQIIK